jgi:hypothetical protein
MLSTMVSPWVATAAVLALAAGTIPASDTEAYRRGIESALSADSGWLTLVALRRLEQGETAFGRASSNGFRLDHPALPARAGLFRVQGEQVTFVAAPGTRITHQGRAIGSLPLADDTHGAPSVLESGSLAWYVIRRGDHRYVRVRDRDHPARRAFRGLNWAPIDAGWIVPARFERYLPARDMTVVDVLGEERLVPIPGALVFERDGRSWRLDAEQREDGSLFVMFADGTTGRETYGAGRYIEVPAPIGERVAIDFNRAYNPPCAYTDFATCPLPPPQNRLSLRIPAGELDYER